MYMRRARHHPSRIAAGVILAALSFAAPGIAAAQTPVRTDVPGDWLRLVPGDVRFYIEINDLSGLRDRFLKLRIWHTVRELTEREGATTSRPSDRLPGLTADNAISQLIGRRCALWAADSTQWQDGVLFAELDRPESVQRWRTVWRANRLPDDGPIQRYTLRGGMRMAAWDRLLVLGPANDPNNLFGKAVELMAGRAGSHLRGQSEFASLSARMKSPFDGLAYVAWRDGDPFALAGCRRMIVGFSVNEDELHCEVHGRRRRSIETLHAVDRNVIERLPANTIAAYSGSFTPKKLASASKGGLSLEDDSLLGLLGRMISAGSTAPTSLMDQIGPRVTVVTGLDVGNRAPNRLRSPSVGLIMESKEPDRVAEQLDLMLGLLAAAASLAAPSPNANDPPIIVEKRNDHGIEFHSVAIGVPLARRLSLPFLADLDIAWASRPGCVMVATTQRELRSLLTAQGGASKPFDIGGRSAGSETDEGEISEWAFVNGFEVSQLLLNWLGHIRRNYPAALQDRWWQSWALERAQARTRLGLGLRDLPEAPGNVVVVEVESTSPAAELLRVGDRVVAVGGASLPASGAAGEVARRYHERGAATVFELTVLRDGRRESIQIPVDPLPTSELQSLEPIRAMRHLIILLNRVDTIQYERFGLAGDRVDLRVRVKWRREDSPPKR